MSGVVVLAGTGPGLSASVAREFADHDWSVGLLARSEAFTDQLAEELRDEETDAVAVKADVTQQSDVHHAFERVREELGPVDALVNNAASFHPGGISDLDPDQFEQMWRVCAYGSFLCSQTVVPRMRERNEGTIIFTGANVSKRAQKGAVGFSSAKFATRGLARGLSRELRPQGIHVAHVVIHGQLDTPRNRKFMSDVDPETLVDPDAVAETYYHLTTQSPRSWTTEVDVKTSQ